MLYIGCDHGGYDLKKEIMKYLDTKGTEYKDCGCDGERCDYPVIAENVCKSLLSDNDRGILICGTGIGISIAANKIKGIRAAVCTDAYTIKYTRLHNDANVMCLGGRVTGAGVACEMTDIFLNTKFEGGRHADRIALISGLENK